MRGIVFLVTAAGLSGCIGSSVSDGEDASAAQDTVPAVMPDFPAVEAGRLAALTGTNREEYQFAGSWEATAARCQDPSLLQILAQMDGFGVIFLVGPSPNPDGVGEYEVVRGTRNIPDTSTARVGVQMFSDPARPHTFRGTDGTVEVQRLDSVIVGRVAVQIQESSFLDTIFMAASFDVPMANAPDDWCQVMALRGVGGAGAGARRPRSRGDPG